MEAFVPPVRRESHRTLQTLTNVQMLEAEYVKDVKKTPVVEFEIPKKVFMKGDASSKVQDGLLVNLWDFS